jgi:hypothetical protein
LQSKKAELTEHRALALICNVSTVSFVFLNSLGGC